MPPVCVPSARTNPRSLPSIHLFPLQAKRGDRPATAAYEATRIANAERPDEAFTTERAVKSGKANASSGRIFVTIPPDHFGPITAEFDPERSQARRPAHPGPPARSGSAFRLLPAQPRAPSNPPTTRGPLAAASPARLAQRRVRPAVSAGGPGRGVLAGPPRVPPVGRALPARRRHRRAEQRGGAVRRPVRRVRADKPAHAQALPSALSLNNPERPRPSFRGLPLLFGGQASVFRFHWLLPPACKVPPACPPTPRTGRARFPLLTTQATSCCSGQIFAQSATRTTRTAASGSSTPDPAGATCPETSARTRSSRSTRRAEAAVRTTGRSPALFDRWRGEPAPPPMAPREQWSVVIISPGDPRR